MACANMNFDAVLTLLRAFPSRQLRVFSLFPGLPAFPDNEFTKEYVIFLDPGFAKNRRFNEFRDYIKNSRIDIEPFRQYLIAR